MANDVFRGDMPQFNLPQWQNMNSTPDFGAAVTPAMDLLRMKIQNMRANKPIKGGGQMGAMGKMGNMMPAGGPKSL